MSGPLVQIKVFAEVAHREFVEGLVVFFGGLARTRSNSGSGMATCRRDGHAFAILGHCSAQTFVPGDDFLQCVAQSIDVDTGRLNDK